ncbi:uncharacterized protein LOC100187071 isoform X1 [Ciona intestinalis]
MIANRRPLGNLDPNSTRVQPTRAAKSGHKWLTNRRSLLSDEIHNNNPALQSRDINQTSNCILNHKHNQNAKQSNKNHKPGKENCDNYKFVDPDSDLEKVALLSSTREVLRTSNKYELEDDQCFLTPDGEKSNTSCVSMEMLTSSLSSLDSSKRSISQSHDVALDTDAILNVIQRKDPETDILDEYTEDILRYMVYSEAKYQPRKDYLEKQNEISSTMRVKLIDWLIEVQDEYKLQNETLHLAVAYVDRFLSEMSVSRPKLQLLGTTSMFLAAKFEEIYPPDADEFAYVTADTYARSEVLLMERLMLSQFKCTLAVPTTLQFLNIFHKKSNLSEDAKQLSFYLSELALLHDVYLQYSPSVRAAAAISLAVCTLRHAHNCDVDNGNADTACGIKTPYSTILVHDNMVPTKVLLSSVLQRCMKDKLQKVFDCTHELARSHVVESNEKNRHFIFEKYSMTKQRSVTAFSPLLSNEVTSQSYLTWEKVMTMWMT